MARRSTEAHGDSQEARGTCADAQATQPGARAQAREEDTRASPSRALGARPARDRARARDGRLARLGGRPRRLAPLGLARRGARRSRAARPARPARARLADARPQRARRPAALPNRPRSRHRRPARRARRGSRRGARRRARWRARPHPRRRGIRDPRRRPRARRRAARDRSLRRSAAPPLGPRRPTGGHRGTPLAGQPRVGRLERRRDCRSSPSRRSASPTRQAPPLDGVEAYPDVVAPVPFSAEPPPLLASEPEPRTRRARTPRSTSTCLRRRRPTGFPTARS